MAAAVPAHALLFPYLLLRGRLTVGPYEIIARGALEDADFGSEQIRADVEGLLAMYELPASVAQAGCVVRRRDGTIGDRFEREEMRPLRRAVVAALLDRNPSSIGQREQGWHVATSDNALIYLHQLDGSGHVAVTVGRMVEATLAGLTIGEEHSAIRAPSELHMPFMGPDPDGPYVQALFSVLSAETPEARHIGRAIDWLDLAWRNTSSIDDDTRIFAIYSGFEALLGTPGARGLGEALSELLEPGTAKTRRPIPTRAHGASRSNLRPRDVTDLEWWFTFFAFLRHDIAHGHEIAAGQYLWNQESQLFLSEGRLREAIKRTVASLGYPWVLLDAFERLAVQLGEASIEDFSAERRDDSDQG